MIPQPTSNIMEMQTIVLEHNPSAHALHFVLFKNVKNSAHVHSQLLARNAEYEYAFLDASILVSKMQLLTAVYKAITARVNGSLRTANVYSEIINSLNPSNNISESYSRFGISAKSTHVVVCKLAPLQEQGTIWTHLSSIVQGEASVVTDESLGDVTDWHKVNQYYKLNGLQWLGKLGADEQRRKKESLVIGAMAVKGV